MNRYARYRETLSSISSTLILGTIIGGLASIAASGFIELIFLFNDILMISAKSRLLAANQFMLTIATIAVPTLGGLVVGSLIWYMTREKRPQGIADIIDDSLVHKHDLSFKNRFVHILSSLVSLGCGASVGQYGPVAYLGGSIGALLSKFSGRVFYHDNIALCCGVAAAISTVFNAPITGVVFVHEVILRHYSLRAFAPVTVAATVGYIIANKLFDKLPLFSIGSVSTASAQEFLLFAFIGLSGAIVAHIFMKTIIYFTAMNKKLPVHAIFKPAIAGIIVGIVAMNIPDVIGVGREAIRLATIDGAFNEMELVILLIVKILLTSLCLGMGFAGGVFSPAVFTGIMFGTLCGILANMIPGIDRSELVFYTICGMVSVTSPIIGAPLTTIIIVLELTRNYSITTAAMISVVLSNIVAYHLFGRSLFDKVLFSRGVDLSSGRDKAVLCYKSIDECVEENYCRIDEMDTLKQTKDKLIESKFTKAYFVDKNDVLMGSIELFQLVKLEQENQDFNEMAKLFCREDEIYLESDTSIWQALNRLESFVGESVAVIDHHTTKKMLGIVYESSVITQYIETTSVLRREENI